MIHRKKESTGYPPRSRLADLFVKCILENRMESCIAAAAKLFIRNQEERNMDSTIPELDFYRNNYELNIVDVSLESVMEDYQSKCTRPLLFVLDEASELLQREVELDGKDSNAFHVFRKRIQLSAEHCKNCMKFFFVCLDTSAKISNFAPYSVYDSSSRIVEGKLVLFLPFIHLAFFDVVASNNDIQIDGIDMAYLATYGRPLWKSLLSKDRMISSIVTLAQSKLIGADVSSIVKVSFKQKLFSVEDYAPIHYYMAAFFNSRMRVNITPVCSMAEMMIASGLSVALHITENRHVVYIDSPSEPLVAEAAMKLMNDKTKGFSWGLVLDYLEDFLKKGIVIEGYRGELVARLILLMAWDFQEDHQKSIATLGEVGKPLKLKDYLTCLFSNDGLKQITVIPDCYVFFNHFISIGFTVNLKDLAYYFKRGAAILCQRNEKTVDLIIPICFSNTVCNEEMGCVLVQVKNRKQASSEWIVESSPSMRSYAEDIGVDIGKMFVLYLHFSREPSFSGYFGDPICGPNTRNANYSVNGIVSMSYKFSDYSCLIQAHSHVLQNLLTAFVDPTELEKDLRSERYAKTAKELLPGTFLTNNRKESAMELDE